MNVRNKGILLLNLGTPKDPNPKSVARYLKEFLSDPRVIDLPSWYWKPILNLFVLPTRSRRVAKLYKSIWMPGGSPLAVYTEKLAQALQAALPDGTLVRHAFTYDEPGPELALAEFQAAGVSELDVVPLYPQYSSTTTAAAIDALFTALRGQANMPALRVLRSWPKQTRYIRAIADSVRASGKSFDGERSLLIFSFHGIPARYTKKGDPYLAECRESAAAIAKELGLPRQAWAMSFQSRFGRELWLQPYTQVLLGELPARGVRDVSILCPGFVVDCLETLEEIAVENRQTFLAAGGSSYTYLPCLNDDAAQVEILQQLLA